VSRPAVTVHCDAESHEPWQRRYTRDEDGTWIPDVVDHFGEPRPLDEHLGDRARKPRRSGGVQFVDAAGRTVPTWDSGQSLRDAVDRIGPMMHRARAAAGVGTTDEFLELGRSYLLCCPRCGDSLKRTGATLAKQFDWAVSQGISRVSLPLLRKLDKLNDELPGR
jgi:hypothetical protein